MSRSSIGGRGPSCRGTFWGLRCFLVVEVFGVEVFGVEVFGVEVFEVEVFEVEVFEDKQKKRR